MKYAIQINASPYHSNVAYSAYQFINTAIKMQHSILRVFFYQEGIYNALAHASPPDDELQLCQLWTNLAQEQGVDLVVCISAAQRRGLLHPDEAKRKGKLDDDIALGFRISGLSQLVESISEADRFMVFG